MRISLMVYTHLFLLYISSTLFNFLCGNKCSFIYLFIYYYVSNFLGFNTLMLQRFKAYFLHNFIASMIQCFNAALTLQPFNSSMLQRFAASKLHCFKTFQNFNAPALRCFIASMIQSFNASLLQCFNVSTI